VKKKHGCFEVSFNVTDNCDTEPTVTAELNGHPVLDGELVTLHHKKPHKKKGCRVKVKRHDGSSDDSSSGGRRCGTVTFECNVFTLTVTATDDCGNEGTGTAEHAFSDDGSSGGSSDDDSKSSDDKSSDDSSSDDDTGAPGPPDAPPPPDPL
jgi:hypothetical protein